MDQPQDTAGPIQIRYITCLSTYASFLPTAALLIVAFMDANNGKHVREGANWSFALRRLISSLLLSPLYIALFLIANGLKILRPLSPQLIPLLVCLLLIPFVFLLSASAGWAVWKNAAVNWKSEMNLQYGCVTDIYRTSSHQHDRTGMGCHHMHTLRFLIFHLNNLTTFQSI